MSASWTTRKMSSRHEEHLADVLNGRMTKGSGNQWKDPADGKHSDDALPYAFSWDGKASLGKSIGVSRAMWEKISEQADGRIPAIPLRFYDDERLTRVGLDLIVIPLDTFAEMLEDANRPLCECGGAQ